MIQGYLTLRWNDSRIKVTGNREENGDLNLDLNCVDSFWKPDVWIESLVYFGTHKIMGDLAKLKIKKDHEVEYWQR